MAKNKYRVTDEKIELIFKLYAEGKSQYEIAEAVELSQGTVQKILSNKFARAQSAPAVYDSVFFNWGDFGNSIIL